MDSGKGWGHGSLKHEADSLVVLMDTHFYNVSMQTDSSSQCRQILLVILMDTYFYNVPMRTDSSYIGLQPDLIDSVGLPASILYFINKHGA